MSKECQLCGTQVADGTDTCPQCGAKIIAAEGGGVAPRARQGMAGKVLKVAIPVVVAIGLYSYYSDAFREYHPVIGKQPEVSTPDLSRRVNSTMISSRIEGPFVIVSLKDVVKHTVVRFTDPGGVQEIPVIAYLTSSGRLVTAMSISEGCRSRDFYLEGEFIHCANCPSYWNASSLEAYACCQKYYPDPIPSTILGDEIRIEVDILRSWQARS